MCLSERGRWLAALPSPSCIAGNVGRSFGAVGLRRGTFVFPTRPAAPLPPGSPGRIGLAGPTLMSGYFRRPPLVGPYFDTGDLGYLDGAGALHVPSQRSDLIVTGGENVYPAEVEAALLTCPGVAAALVFGVADPLWGARVAAALVPTAAELAPTWLTSVAEALSPRLVPSARGCRAACRLCPSFPTASPTVAALPPSLPTDCSLFSDAICFAPGKPAILSQAVSPRRAGCLSDVQKRSPSRREDLPPPFVD